jgi:riboflavin synthase
MFTGIIRHVGEVRAAARQGSARRLRIDVGPLSEGLSAGDSLAVSGACLTVVDVRGCEASFDVVGETLSRTTLGGLSPGDKVNLEPPLAPADGLHGHLVQGHVDGVVEVASVRQGGGEWVVEFASAELSAEMVPKGSVAVDGVSLTLTAAGGGRFSVALVPTTLAGTTLVGLRAGDKVNVETDLIGKYVRRHLEQLAGGGGLTLEKLRQAGFA